MTDCKMLIAGHGGQGVVFLSRLLSRAALLAGDDFITYESHGMAMRGGSVSSQVKIGPYQSPLLGPGEADLLLVLAAGEFSRNQHFLKEGGLALVNSHNQLAGLPPANQVAADQLAISRKLPRALNLIFIGWAAGHPDFPYSYEQLKEAVAAMTPRAEITSANLAALSLGYEHR